MSRLADEVRKTFASMHVSRNFRLFFVGQLISVTGTWVNWTAGAVLVLRLTDSGIALGIETALLFLPVLVLGVWAGSLADRFDKRRILIWANTAYGVLAAVQFALVATGAIRIWMVFTIAFLYGLVIAIEPPTRQSFYAELVGERHITNAVSLNSAVFTGTRVLGGALAGTMIHGFGLWSPYLFDTVSYVAVIAALLAMRPDELHRFDRAGSEPGLVRAGLRYVWRSPELRVPLVVMAAVYLFTFNFGVLIPLQAARTFDGSAREIGWLYAALGLGSFLGAIAMANRQPRPTMLRLAVCAVAFGSMLTVEGVVRTFWLALLAMVLVGYASMLFAISANSTLQRRTRADMRGRVMSLYTTIFLGSTAIGGPIIGWVAERWGAPAAFAVSGIVAIAAGAAAALRARDGGRSGGDDVEPRLSRVDRPRDRAATRRPAPGG